VVLKVLEARMTKSNAEGVLAVPGSAK
jgi:hypothetical protein